MPAQEAMGGFDMLTASSEVKHTHTAARVQSNQPLYYETNFFKSADILRGELETQILSAAVNGGVGPFLFAFSDHRYQFLTASAERIFTRDILEELLGALKSWSTRLLATSHVSTPQVRVFVGGCSRSLLRDDRNSGWHYTLAITGKQRGRKAAKMTVMLENLSADVDRQFTFHRIVTSQLNFNDFLVHRSSCPFGIEVARNSMNPADADIFLDGYFW